MGLVIKVKPGDRLLVNGAILRNAGRSQMVIEVENQSDVLRGREILRESTATTPVRRLCHLIQRAIVDREARAQIVPRIYLALDELTDIMKKSQGGPLGAARKMVDAGQFYHAYRELRSVMDYEDHLLAMATSGRAGVMEKEAAQ